MQAIDKENRRLLTNIADILKNKSAKPGDPRIQFNLETPLQKNKYCKIVSRAHHTNNCSSTKLKGDYSPSVKELNGSKVLAKPQKTHSLNFTQRMRSQQRIHHENQVGKSDQHQLFVAWLTPSFTCADNDWETVQAAE